MLLAFAGPKQRAAKREFLLAPSQAAAIRHANDGCHRAWLTVSEASRVPMAADSKSLGRPLSGVPSPPLTQKRMLDYPASQSEPADG